MISKPVKWRRVGVAALAGVSLTLTALAAQVSPPNTADAAAQPTAAAQPAKPAERVQIKLPTATLDRYVGTWQIHDGFFCDIRRDGDRLLARLTGQPEFEIFAERENFFFWKIVDAQLEFTNDGSGQYSAGILHQWGKQMPLTRTDASVAAAAQASLDARIQNQTAQAGSEAALRRMIDSFIAGKILYDQMEPPLAEVTRQQEARMSALMKHLGAVESVQFKGVGSMGWDTYEVKHVGGKLEYRLTLSPNGKVAGMMTMVMP